MKKLLLIDTFNFLHRAYYAIPSTLTSNGQPVNALYGVTSMFLNIFQALKPDYVVATLDSKGPTNRSQDFEGYKALRKPMDEELKSQIPLVFEMIDAFGVSRINLEGYEADDIIGTITNIEKKNSNLEIIIASNDRDLWQLLSKNILIMIPNSKGVTEWVGSRESLAKFGFDSNLIPDYKALRGDPSDNIPGVLGIGDKTATNLVQQFGTLENIYDNLDNVVSKSVRKKLEDKREDAFMSKKLATIHTDLEINFDLESCRYMEYNHINVVRFLERYNFKSLIKRFNVDEDDLNGASSKKKKLSGDSVPSSQKSLF